MACIESSDTEAHKVCETKLKVVLEMKIKLSGKTLHGKNRINQHGEIWTIIKTEGARVYIESENRTFTIGERKVKDGRWIDLNNDPNFKVEEYDGNKTTNN